jgi:hypothetical protein
MMAQSSTASGVFDWIVDGVQASWSFAAGWLTSEVDSQVLVSLALIVIALGILFGLMSRRTLH